MKRKLAALLCLVLLATLCAACGRGEWVYDLPNGYAIHAENGAVIVEQNGEQALSTGVTAFCAGERYVGIQQTHETDDGTETYWFLLDTENSVFYTSEGEEDFYANCESFGADDLGDWVETAKRPSGAHS